jgi:choline dehydrogenase-like flavoprotein
VGQDWPISYADLRPYYADLEAELPVAGQAWPWGDPHRYPHSPHPMSGLGEMFLRGCHHLGIEARVGPVAITNGRFGNRPHCIYRGFCLQGCKVNAKASTLITHVPDALAHGAEIRADAMVSRIELDDRGRASGVTYFQHGVERTQRARAVAVAGYAIETPRLLLNSAGPQFPDGLLNDHDLVGRYVMVQGAPQSAGRMTEEVRMYKAPPPEVSSEAFYETSPDNDFQRGFSLQCVGPLPITWAEHVVAEGHWGHVLREYMRDYIHWGVIGALCEFLPQAHNRVTLSPSDTDRFGLPVAHFAYSQCDNDRAQMRAAKAVMADVLGAAGAEDIVTIDRYAHLVGGARMGASAADGVVDRNLRSFAVPNLYITDGSVMPTQGAANPALTIMALAARCADHLTAANRGFEAPARTEVG